MNLGSILTKNAQKQYQNYLKEAGLPQSTIKRKLSSLHRFREFAQKHYLKESLPGIDQSRSNPISIDRFRTSDSRWFRTPRASSEPWSLASLTPYLTIAIIALFSTALGIFGYNQIFKQATISSAYPSTPQTPNRYLSFQARLTDTSDTPITTPTDVRFTLYNDLTASGAALLWQELKYIDPDQDGIFSTLLGDSTSIADSVFSENTSLYLGVTVETDPEATPRQAIASVGYALNSETLQGVPLGTGATAPFVPYFDSTGKLSIAAASPEIYSSSGTFAITGQAITLSSDTGTNGDIVIAPDGTGNLDINLSSTTQNGVAITDAALTSGHLLYGYVGNDSATGDLLRLTSGSSETLRFSVEQDGETYISGNLGVGTTDPSSTLEVAGTITTTGFKLTTSPSAGYFLTSDGDGDGTWADVSASAGPWTLNGTDLYPDDTSYNVGIGTTDPGNYKLYVSGNTYLSGTLTTPGLGTGTDNSVLVLNSSNAVVTDEIDPDVWTPGTLLDGNGTANYLPYYSDADTLAISNVYYDGTNTGVGTTAPKGLFHIDGSSGSPSTANSLLTLRDSTSNIGFQIGSTGGYGWIRAADVLVSQDNIDLVLQPAGTNANVGIGITYPSAKLDVVGDVEFDGSAIFNNSGVDKDFRVATNNNTNMFFIDGGVDKIGIGTNAPTYGNLDIRVTANDANTGVTMYSGAGSTARSWITSNDSWVMTRGSTATNGITIASDGNLGIGITSPDYKIDVQGTAGFSSTIYAPSIGADTDNSVVVLNSSGLLKTDEIDPDVWTPGTLIDGSGTANYMTKWTDSDTIANSVAYDDGTNIGIGTTDPDTTLDIIGQLSTSNNAFVGGSNGLGLFFNDSGTYTYGIYRNTPGDLAFRSNTNSEKMVIEATSGNLGVGTTRPKALVSVGTGTPGDIDGTNDLYVLDDIEFDGQIFGDGSQLTGIASAGGWTDDGALVRLTTVTDNVGIGTTDNLAVLHVQGDGTTTGFSFLTQDSSGTDRFAILDNGNVGVGTTAPSEKLDIQGHVNINGYAMVRDTTWGIQLLDNVPLTLGNGADFSLGTDGTKSYWSVGTSLASSTGLTLDSTSNLGIGTTAPTYKLDIVGSLKASGNVTFLDLGTTADNTVLVIDANNNLNTDEIDSRVWGSTLVDYSSTTANYIPKMSDADTITNSLMYDDGTNVGIATTDPGYKLEVVGTAGFSSTIYAPSLGAGTDDSVVVLNGSGNLVTDEVDSRVWGSTLVDYSSTTASYIPKLSDADTLTNSVIYETTNNIGIGTTDPLAKLQVVGSGGDASITTGTQNATQKFKVLTSSLDIGRYNTSPWPHWIQARSDTSSVSVPLSIQPVGGYVGIGTTAPESLLHLSQATANDLFTIERPGLGVFSVNISTSGYPTNLSSTNGFNFQTTGTKLSILSSGNVGIGTTDPKSLLSVGTGTPGSADGTNDLYVLDDIEFDGQIFGDGSQLTGIASAGGWTDDGTDVYLTTTSDNVGIGTTDPNGYKLNVLGSLKASGNVTFLGLGTTADNTVLVIDGNGNLNTDEIDSRVWGSTLIDYSSTTASYIPKLSDADTLVNSVMYEASSNIGIGTTTPSEKLDVIGNIALSYGSYIKVSDAWDDNRTNILRTGYDSGLNTDFLKFYVPGNNAESVGEKMTILRSGNLGIGTTAPLSLLSVGTGTPGSVDGTNDLYVLDDIEFDGQIFGDGSQLTGIASAGGWTDGGTDVYLTTTSDNVGIGTTAPSAKLDVAGNINIDFSTGNTPSIENQGLFIGSPGTASNKAIFATKSGGGEFVITNAGSVGIGTTAPGAKFHVYSAASGQTSAYSLADDLIIENNAAAGLSILTPNTANGYLVFGDPESNIQGYITYQHSDNALRFGTNGSEKVRITTSGNVGIGTTAPTAKLHVVGSSDTEQLIVKGNATQTDNLVEFQNSAGTGLVVVDGTGNVGIGTTGPGSKLHVYTDNSTTNKPGIHIEQDGTGDATLSFERTGAVSYGIGIDATNNYFQISRNTDLATNPYITIDTNGNLGIGTTAPGYKLNVLGIDSDDANNVLAGSQLAVQGTSAAHGIYFRAKGSGSAGISGLTYANQIYGVGGNAGLEVYSSINLILGSGNAERMRITTTGNVGIGTTAPASLLSVGTGTPGSVDGTNDLYVLDDIEFDGQIFGDGSQLTGVSASPVGSALTSAYIWVGNGSNVAAAVNPGGDVEIDNAGATTIQANSVALATDTTGNFVNSITGGSGISSTGATSGENISHTLSLGALSGNWDAGGYEIRSNTLESDVTTGTAPLTIASTTVVTNLNADLLDGISMGGFLRSNTSDAFTSGTLTINDDLNLAFGSGNDWLAQYDEGVDNQLLFITANTAAVAITDPMVEFLVGASPTANQQVFGVSKGTQASNTALFTLDEDGDGYFAGNVGIGDASPRATLEIGGSTSSFGHNIWTYGTGMYHFTFGGSNDQNWKRVARIQTGASQYQNLSIKGKIVDFNANEGSSASQIEIPFSASFRGYSTDNAAINTGLSFYQYARIIRLGVRDFELQIRQPRDWTIIEAEWYVTENYSNASTVTVYNADATGTTPASDIYNPGLATKHRFGEIFAGGNVGIGTTNPTQKLDVVGALNMNGNLVDQVTYLDISAGHDYGVRFWNSDTYKISMGSDQDNHGWVTDYSIHQTMGTTDDRGFTWGYSDTAVMASLEAETGNFAIGGLISIADSTPDNNTYNTIGTGDKDEAAVADGNDLYITDDLEIDGTYYGDGSQLTGIVGGLWTDAGAYVYANNATNTVVKDDGNIGIGTTNPTQKLDVNGNVKAAIYYDSASTTYFLDPAATGNGLYLGGDIVSDNSSFSISSTSNQNITLNAGSGTVVIGATGTGKLDSGTIDPPYTINGDKYATYMASMVGIKEEATGTIYTTEEVVGMGYKHTIDFKSQPKGSDLWLFSKTTDLKKHIEDLVVLLSPAGRTRAWYTLDTRNYVLNIFTSESSLVSYRLTAPRFDSDLWKNTRAETESTGFVIDDPNDWQENLDGTIIGASTAVSEVFNTVKANLTDTTDLVTDSITLQGQTLQAYITQVVEEVLADLQGTEPGNILSPIAQFDQLTVTGDSTISGQLVATEITTDSLTAQEINSPAIDSIRTKLANLTDQYHTQTATASAETVGTDPALLAMLQDLVSATDSAHIAVDTLDAKFGFFENYLAVLGKTVTTDLDVTNTLTTNSIASLDNQLFIQPSGVGAINFLAGLVTMDSTGMVTINGDLDVNGNLTAQKARFDTLVLGSKTATPSSQFAQLLELRNDQGSLVASINDSGSAKFNDVTAQGFTIASDASASAQIATASASISTNATAGKAILPEGLTEFTINTPNLTNDTLVYVTPIGDSLNQVLYVKSKKAGEWFKVAINQALPHDLEFNWWIIKLQ
jgi:hypothetical protein